MTAIIRKFLLNDKNIDKSAVFWNALSAMMNSFQTMVLLMIITRGGSMEDSGIFVMAYAVGNLMLNVGKFGVRQFQVTDVLEKYSLKSYVSARKLSTLLMLVFTAAYVGYNLILDSYTLKKAIVVGLICFMKAIEAYEDVYHGRMQQKGRLDVAGKILGTRLFLFIVGFTALYIFTGNLLLTTIINVIITLLLAVYLNHIALKALNCIYVQDKKANVKALIAECFPLCACMCMNMYIANAPKYVIDTVVVDDVQTCFNIVFMPVFIIALLANFIFQPYLKRLGEIWANKDFSLFRKKIYQLSAVVVLACIFIVFVGRLIGTQILGLIYKVDLSEYKGLLTVFMVAGGIIALQNLFVIAITIVRYQKYMIYGYIMTAVIILAAGSFVLNSYGITALSIFHLGTMILLLLYCIGLFTIALIQKNKHK